MSGGVGYKTIVMYKYRYRYIVIMFTHVHKTYPFPFLWRTFGWTALWTLAWTALWTLAWTALWTLAWTALWTLAWTALWTLVGTVVRTARWNFIPSCVHLEAIDVCLLFHQLPFLIFEFIQAFSKIFMYSVWTKPQWIHLSSLSLLLVGVLQEYFCSFGNHLWLVFSVIRFFLPLLCSVDVGFNLLECFLS